MPCTRRRLAAWALPVLLVGVAFDSVAAREPLADPLPSWRDGAAKRAILDFVRRVSTPDSPDEVPEAERVAVFDNDGTLWPEYPVPFQAAFAMDRLRDRVAAEPALADDAAVKALFAGDLPSLLAGDRHEGLHRVLALTHSGDTVEAFDASVADWLAAARHPRFRRRYDDLAYRPMLEVLALFGERGFKTWIVSGGGADFMRVWTERVYGIPPERVVGSTTRPRFEMRAEGPVLVKTLDHLFVDDREGKPVGIRQFIGRRPIACFGNSDGDLAMLRYTTVGNPRPSLGVVLHHTDAAREYAYDVKPSGTGRLEEGLAEAPRRGWTLVDMAGDWATVFGAGDEAEDSVVPAGQ